MKMEKGRKLISKLMLFLGALLSLALVLMPGMSFKVYAATDTYTNLIPIENDTDFSKIVSFNGYKWFIIKDESTSATEGTVTLLAQDNSFGFSVFSENQSSDYRSSKVRAVLDALTAEGGSFAGVKNAILDTDLEDVGVSGAKLYLLSVSEADHPNIRCMYFGDAMNGAWWLRTQGLWSSKETPQAAFVDGFSSCVADLGADVANNYGVRPALRLDLSSVVFLSDTNTFVLKTSENEVTYKVVGGTWSDGTAAEKTEMVQICSKPTGVPTGMKASDGYTGGAWDTDPSTATITKATTFTYTFTAKQAATVTQAPTAKKLTYNGKDQQLVAKGTASNDNMYYAVTRNTTAPEASAYKTSVPTGKDAGTYYVWYMAKGDAEYNDSDVNKVKVTIARKDPVQNGFNTSFKFKQSGGKYVISWNGQSNVAKVQAYVTYMGTSYPKTPITTKKNSVTVKKINNKKIDLTKVVKVYLIGYDSKGKKVGQTVDACYVGKNNKKYTNVKSFTLNKTSVTVKKGKKIRIKKSAIKLENARKKQYSAANVAEMRFKSTNSKIAKVNKDGRITGVGEGTCTVYAYARNGLSRKVSVTVKK